MVKGEDELRVIRRIYAEDKDPRVEKWMRIKFHMLGRSDMLEAGDLSLLASVPEGGSIRKVILNRIFGEKPVD